MPSDRRNEHYTAGDKDCIEIQGDIQEEGMKKTTAKNVLEIPRKVWETAETKENIEDWLLAHNPKLVKQLLRIRCHEDLTGQGKALDEVARR